jgi:hypothetical protein
MTVTTPAQTDELRIVTTPPSIAEAQLLVQIMHMDAVSGANAGWLLLTEFETPPTLAQLRKRHQRSSAEYRQISAFLMSCETIGTFVKQGILGEGLVNDLFWVTGAWAKSEKICKGMRKEAGEPRIFENFEALAARAT